MKADKNIPKTSFSLKYKILFLLIVITGLSLSGFLWISLYQFKNDKMKYILENSTQFTFTESEVIGKEFEKTFTLLQLIANSFNPVDLNFETHGETIFKAQKTILKAQIVEFIGSEKKKGAMLNKTSEELNMTYLPFNTIKETKKIYLFCVSEDMSKFLIVNRLSEAKYQYLVAEIFIPHIKNLMANKSFLFALYCPNNKDPFFKLNPDTPRIDIDSDKESLAKSRSITRQVTGEDEIEYLMSISGFENNDLKLISFIDKEKVSDVIQKLQVQAILFFISILAIICIVALFSANQLTSALEELTNATILIAGGNFNFNLKVRSRDEIFVLAHSFNRMKIRILELLEETKKSARMEAELETATTVQSTLFPPPKATSDSFELVGLYRTASECGGDLWHYFETETYLMFFIGDVVGHGVPAALMTTAARSVTSIVRIQKIDNPAEILRLLNHSIFETSKGKMWMTFFVGRFDKITGNIIYSSASHTTPMLFQDKEQLKKKDVQFLMESSGPSLGREEFAEYSNVETSMGTGDLLFLYTDGLTECANKSKELLGETAIIRGLIKHWNRKKDCDSFNNEVTKIMEEFRDGHPLEDDVTFCSIRRKS